MLWMPSGLYAKNHICILMKICVKIYIYTYIYILFLEGLGLNSGPHIARQMLFFVLAIFEIVSCDLFAWGCFWMEILLISASWIARITGVSHLFLAERIFLMTMLDWIFPSQIGPYRRPKPWLEKGRCRCD
jgi:hypothetical protein